MIGDPYQVLSDCPHCRVEAAVVALMDPLHPACHLGVAAEQRCRLCGWTLTASDEPFAPALPLSAGRCPACRVPLPEAARSGETACPGCAYAPSVRETSPPRALGDAPTATDALARWASEEGEPDADAFCRANMGSALDVVVARLVAGERVETTFDVIAWLFPGGGGGGGPDRRRDERPIEVVDRAPVAGPAAPAPAAQPTLDPRTATRVLVSVMVADGELREGELAFVRRFLELEGLPPVDVSELRVWRPGELGPIDPALRDRLLEAAVQLAHLDRERDGSEWKVIQAYAKAWGVPEARIDAWDRAYDRRYATAMTRLWRTLSGLVRVR